MENVPDHFLKNQSVEIKSMTPEEMDLAEMQVYGDVSREYDQYKVKVSKHSKKKSQTKEKNKEKLQGKDKTQDKSQTKEYDVKVDKTLKEVVLKLKFS